MDNIIEIKGLSKSYYNKKALRDLNLNIKREKLLEYWDLMAVEKLP